VGAASNRRVFLQADWIANPDVGADEIAVLAVLSMHANADGICWPSQGTIASRLNRSRSWVNRVLAHLEEIGLIHKTRRQRDDGGDRSCLYRIIGLSSTVRNTGEHPGPLPCCNGVSVSPDGNTGCAAEHTELSPNEQNPDSLSTGARPDAENRRESSAKSEVPADWQPDDADLCWAIDRFPEIDLANHVEGFVTKCRAKGYQYADLSSAWRSWVMQDAAAMRRGRTGPAPIASCASPPKGIPAAYIRFQAWSAVAAHVA
jgi:hypothetical protein